MNDFNPEDYFNVAVKTILTSVKICRNVQAVLTDEFHQKKDRSPVTIADYATQAVINHHLHTQFPDIPMIGEEDSEELQQPENASVLSAAISEVRKIGIEVEEAAFCDWIDEGQTTTYSDLFWTLDPIDGTKGFLRKEQYAISLALVKEGVIVMGFLACPNLKGGTLYYAIQGQGAFVSRLEDPLDFQPIRVSSQSDITAYRMCESVESGHSSHDLMDQIKQSLTIKGESLRIDSQAKYASVACGDAECYLRLPTRIDYREKIWDHAGGVIIVEEAGGIVSDVHGKKLDFTQGYSLKENSGVVVSNGARHYEIVDEINRLSSGTTV